MKVSIVIPVYNVEPYIEACLQSVANQTLTEGVECLIVDDCGTDRSVAIAERFIEEYHGNIAFAILHHEHNRGLSAARNTGIRSATGEYLFFLDSDDRITSDCIESFDRLFREYPNVDYIQGSYVSVRDLSKFWDIPFPEYTTNRKLIKSSMLDYDTIPVNAQNRMVRHELIIDNQLFFKEGIIHEDNLWTFFLSKYVMSMAYNRHPSYIYTINPDSITSKIDKDNECKAWKVLIEDISSNIDSFEVGAQKRILFYTLLNMQKTHSYFTEESKERLINIVWKMNNCLERPLLYLCVNNPKSSIIYKIAERLLNRIYKYFN